MSGGGSSGSIDFPTHMKDIHKDWFGYSGAVSPVNTEITEVMNNALGTGGNPFESVTLTDPSSDFDEVETRYDAFETEVDALDEEADWQSIIDSAVSKIDSAGVLNDIDTAAIANEARGGASDSVDLAIEKAVDAINGDIIKNAVEQYQKRTNIQKERTVSRFSRTMADVNAVNSSAYMFGLAIIEAQHLQDVDQFQSQLEVQTYDRMIQNYTQFFQTELEARLRADLTEKQSRDRMLAEASQLMAQMLSSRINAYSNTTELLNKVKGTRTSAVQDYELADVDINYKFSRWDFEVYERAANVFGSIHGSAGTLPAQPSKAGSAIAGALSGAASGAAVGSAVPGIGTAVGAGVGAALGAGSALV